MNKILFLLALLLCNISFSQVTKDIDPKWDNYYKENPSRVYDHYQGTDFIAVIEKVGFVPISKLFEKNVNFLKRMLLTFTQDQLELLSSEGWYYSRTFKHDDYFYLYNMTYKKLTKEVWNLYCPYLIPLMNLDGIIDLK